MEELCSNLLPAFRIVLLNISMAYSRISHEYPSLFRIVINLIFFFFFFFFFFFRFDALARLGAFMLAEFLCISVLTIASGPRVKLAS